MKAELLLIKWILNDSGISRYQISKNTGIHQTTLGNLVEGKSLYENLSFRNAAALTSFAEKAMKEDLKMNTYLTPEGMEFVSNEEVYPSDNGEFVHVIAWPKDLYQEDKYLLTFRANPDYRPGHDGPEEWSDWVVISAKYVGDCDAVIKEDNSRTMTLSNGDVIDKNSWNGDQWNDNGKRYRPLYSYDFESGDTEIEGVEVK